MRARDFLVLVGIGLAAALFPRDPNSLLAQAPPAAALTGRVTSAEEGRMEGVVVSARKTGATMTVSVASDSQGQYRFPAGRLEPGKYSLRVRAVGYDLDGDGAVEIGPHKTATADLKLRKTRDLAAQLTNAEWLASFPGTAEQKESIRGCTHCHTLEVIVRSHHDSGEFMQVLERMANYPALAFPLMPQILPVQRQGPGEDPLEQRQAARQKMADYLCSINLSSAKDWGYSFRTLPRPRGRDTKVIMTEYDLPKPTRQPHDVIVDSDGMVWYDSFGEQILGKLDPRTGKITEYSLPISKPGAPTGSLDLQFDEDGNIWIANQFQAAILKFDQKTERFQTWVMPPEFNRDYVQITEVSPGHHNVDGKVWVDDAGTWYLYRVDLASNKWESFEPFKVPRPNIYDVVSDAQNNVYFTVYGRAHIGRIDAKTGKITLYQTPTPHSAPRRGMMDAQGRLWFGENRGDRIGMFDTKTERFQEWAPPTPGNYPYDATVDKNGEVWSGGEYNDRVLRLDPRTGEFAEYLLPRETNIRRVFVDNATNPVTFWVGNNHKASIVKVEPLDSAGHGEAAALLQ
jgi:virginiamycin B lyase